MSVGYGPRNRRSPGSNPGLDEAERRQFIVESPDEPGVVAKEQRFSTRERYKTGCRDVTRISRAKEPMRSFPVTIVVEDVRRNGRNGPDELMPATRVFDEPSRRQNAPAQREVLERYDLIVAALMK